MTRLLKLLWPLAVCCFASCHASAEDAKPLIPYTRFTLPNGLRVIVHEDHKAPVVAVRVAYHVGSKDEVAGKTGFAHLFEHLMFAGSKNFKGSIAQTLGGAGATDVNAVTTPDSTQYHETVPTPALELALWIESDRMGHFAGTITQEKLDTERGVVQNEKRQREAGPMGGTEEIVMAGVFPEGHPYRRSPIGSMEDLNAASVADVKSWFDKYYGASNAVVVLSGDIDVPKARQLMEKYFSDVPPGEPLGRPKSWVPQLPSDVVYSMHAHVPQTLMHWVWPVPAIEARDYSLLEIVARVLGGGVQERLNGELVERRKLASRVGVGMNPMQIASTFSIFVEMKPDADPAVVQRVLDEQLSLFLQKGPTNHELQRVKSDLEVLQIRGLSSVGAKAAVLANAELNAGNPGFDEISDDWIMESTPQIVRAAAQRWLEKPAFKLTIHPFGELQASEVTFDRRVMPTVGDSPEVRLPPIQEATLSNGMKVVLAEQHAVPALSFQMVFANAGARADLDNAKRGVAEATYNLMNAGPAGLSKAAFSQRAQDLHIDLGIAPRDRHAISNLSALRKDLQPALKLWAEVLRHPAFRAADLEEWRASALQSVADETTNLGAVASRTLFQALYPTGHPLAPRAPQQEQAILKTLQIEDLRAFHAAWLRPDIAKLFVVGDTTMPELKRELERVFGDWRAPATAVPAEPTVPATASPSQPRFILVDWADSQQTTITGGRFVMPAKSDETLILQAANHILGGGMSARLSQRLRVEEGWTYGIGSGANGALDPQYWGFSTAVQANKTAESVVEILKVIREFTGPQPATQEELARYIEGHARSIPGAFEQPEAVLHAMVDSEAYSRPYTWIEGAQGRLRAMKLADVNRVAREYFKPDSFTWVLVGELAQFEQKLREMNVGTIEVWDRQGTRIR